MKNLIGWCRISKQANTVGDHPKQQVEYNGKVADAVIIFPYGMYANMPADVLAVKLAVNSDAENRVVIGCAPPNRPNLAAGEVAIYHPDTGDMIKISSAGITITASKVTVEAPEIMLDGNVSITGDAAIDGNLTVGPLAKDFLTHTHIGSPTAPVGPVSPTGVVL